MNERIYIPVPCWNRKRVVELCLPTMRDSKGSQDYLDIWNDGSTEYDSEWLTQFGDHVEHSNCQRGVQVQRKAHFVKFSSEPTFTHMYLSDSDAFVDPLWRERALEIQARYPHHIVCLYNTVAHTGMPFNVSRDNLTEDVFFTKYAPGISYLLTRANAMKVMAVLQHMAHFDWFIPSVLGHRCVVSRTSYVDHLGVGGDRHPEGVGPEGGDRATSPTPFLVAKREEFVEILSRSP